MSTKIAIMSRSSGKKKTTRSKKNKRLGKKTHFAEKYERLQKILDIAGIPEDEQEKIKEGIAKASKSRSKYITGTTIKRATISKKLSDYSNDPDFIEQEKKVFAKLEKNDQLKQLARFLKETEIKGTKGL